MKTPTLTLSTFCIAALLGASTVTANANLVVNPGFETGNFSGWTVNDPDNFTGVGSDAAFAHSGTHYAFLGAHPDTGSLSQNLATMTGASYTLSFFLANDITVNQNLSPSTEFDVYFGGTLLLSLMDPPAMDYTQYTFGNLVASGPSTTLEFRYMHGNDFFRLDDVSVNPSGVPDSGSTVWLALPIFAGLGLLGYRARLTTRLS